jgi:hypothetical protein
MSNFRFRPPRITMTARTTPRPVKGWPPLAPSPPLSINWRPEGMAPAANA